MAKIIITCKNCGAEYDEVLDRCPYCGQENEVKSEQKYATKLRHLETERKGLPFLPKRIVNMVGNTLFKVILLAVVVIVAGVFIMTGIGKLRDRREQEKEDKNVQVMEQMLQDRDYEELYTFYRKQEYTYLTYDKYDEIATVYYHYLRLQSLWESYEKYVGKVSDDLLIDDIAGIMQEWKRLQTQGQEMIEDRKRMGNEQYLQEIMDMGKAFVMEKTGAEEELLQEIVQLDSEDEEGFRSYAEELWEKQKGKQA